MLSNLSQQAVSQLKVTQEVSLERYEVMNKKGDQSIHIAGSASFSAEKKNNNLVWKDKNGFIKKKCGFITFFVITQQYHTK